MIYPVVAYGHPVLKKVAEEIDKESIDIKQFVEDMFETMYNAHGVGLAAPQIGKSIRVFVVDGSPMADEDPKLEDFKKVFINPIIVSEEGEKWDFEEGCLSIPDVREAVSRHSTLTINYLDENWVEHEETFDGLRARIIQHEYDHIEGVLFIDYLSAFKKRLIKKKLTNISKGIVKSGYRMVFPK
ncbi:peptide deformylase [Aureibacter tunicatorum]|uniref:Peptide deformylase n=1 Tax=Aureibacter tunicatorum TaxID=866807 RepID=A0AAE3XM48_9BACT|nr:peptide deformylase [Aureibacter tunicatorum]MDR6239015.1 peptide deformylase [Aureibacter tunicatorum]BDD05059.1 peptide deformylase [Aureibacter tunicatorum]